MRDWKVPWPPKPKPKGGTEFKAYLWGIERLRVAPNRPSLGNLKPTYEGLKGEFRIRHWSRGANLKPTYEGLKVCSVVFACLAGSPLFKAYLWGIERRLVIVFPFPQSLFKAYLWGIESNSVAYPPPDVLKFKAYLWGIESVVLPWSWDSWAVFKAYLWGIERVETQG